MHFSNIELYNYGIYKGKHNLSLSDRTQGRNITLIGGLNGRGKTTLLDSVFLCLYGRKAIEYITGKKESYSKVLRDRINKSSADKTAYIKLTICLDDDEETILSIKRAWSQKERKIETTLIITRNGIEDKYLSDNWEYYVEELIPLGVARLFFFDNEKISQIADDDAFDQIKDSIKAVMGISTIESLCSHVEKIRKDKLAILKKSDSTDLTSDSDQLNSAIEEVENSIRVLCAQRASLVPELEKTNVNLESTEQDFWKRGGNLGINRDNIIKDQEALKDKITSLRDNALALASNPAVPLCLCSDLMTESFNRIESSENNRAIQYSKPIITKMYSALLSDVKLMLSDQPEIYKSLSDLIDAQLKGLSNVNSSINSTDFTPLTRTLVRDFIEKDAHSFIQEATTLINENQRANTALSQLEVHLTSDAEKDSTVELLNKIKELQEKKGRIEANIAQIDEKIKSANNEKEELLRRQNKLLLKIATEADTSDDNVRILEYSTMTLEVMHEFEKRLQAQKVSQFEKNISACFDFLSQKECLITTITIDPETLDITLRDYNGGVLLKDQLSAGEKQIFAISILWGLALASGYKLPVIIDTPMGRLDSNHRSNFINKYLPNASSQVIILSTDEEITGKYLEDIKEYVLESYTLIYDEEEKCSNIVPGYFGGDMP